MAPTWEDFGALGRLLAYLRPTFMFPAVGMSAYGAALAPASSFDLLVAVLHAATVGLALFVAHLRDGLVDGHVRGEETPLLSVAVFRWSIGVGAAVVLALAAILLVAGGVIAAASAIALLALALLHAPYLDRHPLTVTVDYPLGIGIALVGGYATQTGGVAVGVVAVATAFGALLSGIKIGIDRLDAAFDSTIEKRTIPVAYGTANADRIAFGVFGGTALLAAGLGAAGVAGAVALVPAFAFAAAAVPVGCLAATALATDERAVQIQMGLTYVFAVLLFLSTCGGECAGLDLLQRALEALSGS